MNASPGLNTLLVQRLDAVLGTSIASQAHLISGIRADAVTQPNAAGRIGKTDNNQSPNNEQILEAVRGKRNNQDNIKDSKLATALKLSADGRLISTASTSSAPTSLGRTAQLILALLTEFPNAPASVLSKTPLWQTLFLQEKIPTPAVLAQNLRQALQTSGLFYESHLLDLAFGQKNLAQIKIEPQAQFNLTLNQASSLHSVAELPNNLSENSTNPIESVKSADSVDSVDSGNHPTIKGLSSQTLSKENLPLKNLAPSALRLSENQEQSPASVLIEKMPVTGLQPDMALLARQQLEVLANQAIVWQGAVWPGAKMEWQVSREEVLRDGSQSQEEISQQTWTTRLTLNLPNLGKIEAKLNLAGKQIVMQLASEKNQTLLTESGEALRERFNLAGLILSNLSVTANSSLEATDLS